MANDVTQTGLTGLSRYTYKRMTGWLARFYAAEGRVVSKLFERCVRRGGRRCFPGRRQAVAARLSHALGAPSALSAAAVATQPHRARGRLSAPQNGAEWPRGVGVRREGSVLDVEMDPIHGTLHLVLIAPRNQECLMTFIAVRCPHCQSEQIVKRGKTSCGTQRYLCQNTTCTTGSFLLDYR